MTVLSMPHFVGHYGLEFFQGQDPHKAVGNEYIAVSRNNAHDAGSQHPAFKNRPAQDVAIFQPLFSKEFLELSNPLRGCKGTAPPPIAATATTTTTPITICCFFSINLTP